MRVAAAGRSAPRWPARCCSTACVTVQSRRRAPSAAWAGPSRARCSCAASAAERGRATSTPRSSSTRTRPTSASAWPTRAGTRCYVPAARAVHHEQLATDAAAAARRIVEFHRDRDRYMRKHHGRGRGRSRCACSPRWPYAAARARRAGPARPRRPPLPAPRPPGAVARAGARDCARPPRGATPSARLARRGGRRSLGSECDVQRCRRRAALAVRAGRRARRAARGRRRRRTPGYGGQAAGGRDEPRGGVRGAEPPRAEKPAQKAKREEARLARDLADLRLQRPAATRYLDGRPAPAASPRLERGGSKLIEFQPVLAKQTLFLVKNNGRGVRASPRGRDACGGAAASARSPPPRPRGRADGCTSPRCRGAIIALDARTRARPLGARTSRAAPSPRRSSCDGRVYFGSENGTVYALRASDGRVLWTYKARRRREGRARLLAAASSTSATTAARSPRCARATAGGSGRTGTQGRAFGRAGRFYSTPAVTFGRVYIGNTDGRVYSFVAQQRRARVDAARRAATCTPRRPWRACRARRRPSTSAPTTAASTRSTRARAGRAGRSTPAGRSRERRP